MKEFIGYEPDINSITSARTFFANIEDLSKKLKIAILHGYIKAKFDDGNQVIYLTKKGSDRVHPIKE